MKKIDMQVFSIFRENVINEIEKVVKSSKNNEIVFRNSLSTYDFVRFDDEDLVSKPHKLSSIRYNEDKGVVQVDYLMLSFDSDEKILPVGYDDIDCFTADELYVIMGRIENECGYSDENERYTQAIIEVIKKCGESFYEGCNDMYVELDPKTFEDTNSMPMYYGMPIWRISFDEDSENTLFLTLMSPEGKKLNDEVYIYTKDQKTSFLELLYSHIYNYFIGEEDMTEEEFLDLVSKKNLVTKE